MTSKTADEFSPEARTRAVRTIPQVLLEVRDREGGHFSRRATYVDGPMASTFFASNDLVGFGHMSGLLARKHVPLALMKSDDLYPYQSDELCAHVALQRGIPELRW